MISNKECGEHDDDDDALPEDVRIRLRQAILLSRTIDELASGTSLLNIINLVDSHSFIGPIESQSFCKGGIVWFIQQPSGQSSFESLFCTVMSTQDAEFGGTEYLDAVRLSDNARQNLREEINGSALGAPKRLRTPNVLLKQIQSRMTGVTSKRMPVCIIASYNMLKDDAITLFAYHPRIEPKVAVEIWLAHFS